MGRPRLGPVYVVTVVNTELVRKWWALWGTVVLALSLVTGFFPGSSTRATVDHCYRRLPGDGWTPYETKCTGRWSTAGFTVTGRVHLVSGVSRADWYNIGLPLPEGWYEVSVPGLCPRAFCRDGAGCGSGVPDARLARPGGGVPRGGDLAHRPGEPGQRPAGAEGI